MVMTLCRDCLAVFVMDCNYIVRPAAPDLVDKHDDECFVCSRAGRDYSIVKIKKGVPGCQPPSVGREQTFSERRGCLHEYKGGRG